MLSLVKHTDIADDRIWSDVDVSFSRHCPGAPCSLPCHKAGMQVLPIE